MEQSMEQRLAALEHEVQRQADYIAIANLMGRYQYLHTAGKMDEIGRELFASELPDAHSEYGPLGVFGPEKSIEFFNAMTERFTHGRGEVEPGLLELHQITTPVIEIAGDGKTAKAMWMSTGAILMRDDPDAPDGQSATWDS
ncbi:MAG: nuclear transport factor 2 family protein, partial [Bradyrhizobium sp.]